jgi:hypothetical protein
VVAVGTCMWLEYGVQVWLYSNWSATWRKHVVQDKCEPRESRNDSD